MAEPSSHYGPAGTPIEVVPVVVLSQVFPARPSSIPDIRDFVRRCLAESPLTEEGTREVGETVFRALLDAAGPTGSIQVAFRIFPEHVEVDVLHSDTAIQSPVTPGPPFAYTQPARLPTSPGRAGLSAPARGAARALSPEARRRGKHVRLGGRDRQAGDVRRMDVQRAAPRGADTGSGRSPTRCLGQDGQPLGRRRYRAADAGPTPNSGSVRRGSAAITTYNASRNCAKWARSVLTDRWTSPHMCPTLLPWRFTQDATSSAPIRAGLHCGHPRRARRPGRP